MNISVSFHITVRQHPTLDHYRMLVEHYYSSPEVERFKVNGAGGKFVAMEKILMEHGGRWQVIGGDFAIKNYERVSMGIMSMQIAIDEYLKVRKDFPQNEGYFDMEKNRDIQ